MSSFKTAVLVLTIATAWSSAAPVESGVKNSTLACFFEENVIECAAERIDAQLDQIQNSEPGEPGTPAEPPISHVLADTRDVLSQGVEAFGTVLGFDGQPDEDDDAGNEEDDEVSSDNGEARKKKLGKKKKKALQKVLMLAMVLKAKISLLVQLFSAHLQVKAFIIGVLSLLLNAARLWISLKKSDQPSKVIYYEHAQHQHHYDHEDDHSGYWGRSSDDAQELAYGHHDHKE